MARFQYQQIASPPQQPAAPALDPLTWQPNYPTPRGRRNGAVYVAAFFGVFAVSQALPALAWQPTYPARVHRVRTPLQGHQDAVATLGTPQQPTMGWQATYPSQHPRRRQAQGDLVTRVFVSLPIGWRATYPDRIAKRELRQSPSHVAPIVVAAPLQSWSATYPDYLARKPFPKHLFRFGQAFDIEPFDDGTIPHRLSERRVAVGIEQRNKRVAAEDRGVSPEQERRKASVHREDRRTGPSDERRKGRIK